MLCIKKKEYAIEIIRVISSLSFTFFCGANCTRELGKQELLSQFKLFDLGQLRNTEERITAEEEAARRIRAEIEKKNRDLASNYHLFKEKYCVRLEELSKDIKNKRMQCNNFTYGNGLLGMSKKTLFYLFSYNEAKNTILNDRCFYLARFNFNATIFSNKQRMLEHAEQTIKEMKQELDYLDRKIADTTALEKIFAWII